MATRKRAPKVDRDKLRAALLRLPRENTMYLLDAAIEMLSDAQLMKLTAPYLDLAAIAPDSKRKGTLLADVMVFEAASLRGDYYEGFNVNSRNFMEKSRGTESFIADCNRLLDRCVAAVDVGGHDAETCGAFERLFAVLRAVDDGSDSVVFFADEAGSWQVGVEWERVLKAWFRVLASTAEATVYAARVVDVVAGTRENHHRDAFMKAARAAANKAQRAELNVLSEDVDR